MTDTTTPEPFTQLAKKITIDRVFTSPNVDPYSTVEWSTRTISQTDWRTGKEIFHQDGVEFPVSWSDNAATIVTTKYFRGEHGTPEREHSLRQLIDRVVGAYTAAGVEHGYFTEEASSVFRDELTWLLVHQYFSFNSPVWFNVGTTSPQQVSACFILHVEDTLDSILNWYTEEGRIFKGGSGAGVNISAIRGSNETLRSSGGSASGPVSFMRGADASAGTIKSGGATRRAAKMVVLDVDHPDIEEFIETKSREETKIRVLRDAGFDMDLGGEDIASVQYQNANNSVRVTDEFMRAEAAGEAFGLRSRTTGNVTRTVDSRGVFKKMAKAAWECADPGVQYHDTINQWHTLANTGPITASNPCSEYMSVDNSSCNLASLNLMKFLDTGTSTFNVELFVSAVELIITAMDISISFADFPTEPIAENTRRFRQLGIGYANLGALLMATGLPYDSQEGRDLAAAITSVMTGAAYRRSAQIASVVGAYDGYKENEAPHRKVMGMHADAASQLVTRVSPEVQPIASAGEQEWHQGLDLGDRWGWRNSQASVLAPTGTIGFMMDCDTTGIEPDFSLVKFKKLVGGGSMQIVNQAIPVALTKLGYAARDIDLIVAHILEHGSVIDAPVLQVKDYPIFDTATGTRAISPMGHVDMMAAVQPFLSGAISKTVNLPETATVEDIEDIYRAGWVKGLKALAVYRDNCKVGQPLSSTSTEKTDTNAQEGSAGTESVAVVEPKRRRLPSTREAKIHKFTISSVSGYVIAGEHDDGTLGELFVRVSKQGSTLSGILDGLAMAVSVGLQYGVPLETFVAKYVGSSFEPAGLTNDPDVRLASSILDWMFRRLAIDYLPPEVRQMFGIYTTEERSGLTSDTPDSAPPAVVSPQVENSASERVVEIDKPMCMVCGESTYMVRSGACFVCSACGTSTGCS